MSIGIGVRLQATVSHRPAIDRFLVWAIYWKIRINEKDKSKKFEVEFYSDFSQLKYVFAEIITKAELIKGNQEEDNSADKNKPIDAKLQILEDELEIIEQSNLKFKEENENLKSKINDLDSQITNYQFEISKLNTNF